MNCSRPSSSSRSAMLFGTVVTMVLGAGTGCMPSTARHAVEAQKSSGEWVSGPVDLRKSTAVIRVAPPARLKASMEAAAAKSEDADISDFLRMHAGGGFGSGFLVVHTNASGTAAFVVTNRHVVAGAEDAEITFGDGTTYKAAEIVYASPKDDLAVLALPESAIRTFGYGLKPVTGGVRERLTVVATGYPGVSGQPSYQVTDGRVSNAKFSLPEVGFDETLVQHTAPIDPGSSGGPLTTESGDVVGVNVMLMRKRSSMFFAVPAESMVEAVRTAHDLVARRRSVAWMASSLQQACGMLAAELASRSGSPERVMPFVSTQLVAEQGLESYAGMMRTKFGRGVREQFFEDPIGAMKTSVMLRVVVRSELDGGALAGPCADIHPADVATITDGKPVRLALRTKQGSMELRWKFEQGAWRVAGGDLLDVRPLLAPEPQEAPARKATAKTSAKQASNGSKGR